MIPESASITPLGRFEKGGEVSKTGVASARGFADGAGVREHRERTAAVGQRVVSARQPKSSVGYDGVADARAAASPVDRSLVEKGKGVKEFGGGRREDELTTRQDSHPIHEAASIKSQRARNTVGAVQCRPVNRQIGDGAALLKVVRVNVKVAAGEHQARNDVGTQIEVATGKLERARARDDSARIRITSAI